MSLPVTPETIWTAIRARGEAPFWIAPSGSRSSAAFAARVAAIAGRFDAQGIGAGERIAICHEDDFDAAASFLAALLTGRVPTIVSPGAGDERLGAICRAVEAAGLVSDDRRSASAPHTEAVRLPTRAAGLARLFGRGRDAAELAPANVQPEGLAYLLFTSGTTSDPKGVMITWRNLTSHLATLARVLRVDGASRICNPTPISHTDGLVMGPLLAAVTGAAVIRPGPFLVGDIERWLEDVARNRPTHVVTNPTTIALIERYARRDDYFPKALLVSSASHLRGELWEKVERRFEVEVVNLYGLTETVTTALYAGRLPEMGPVASLGVPIDCEARLGDENGDPVAPVPGAEGEIQLRGAHIFAGYWRSPARDAETFTADGWMRTGDLARHRADGAYDFLGRRKAAINCGGTLIRGEEIDECMLRHPKVVESVTVALPDPDFEEVPVTAVVARAAVDEAELSAHAQRGLEPLRVPKRIVRLDAIPRGESGKPKLEALRDLLSRQLDEPTPQAEDLLHRVTSVAARVFRVAASDLRPESGPDTVKSWDSFSHLNLIVEVERQFGIRLPARRVATIRTIRDLHDAVGDSLA